MIDDRVAGRLPLAVQYALHFCTVGVLLPFLPAYLRSLSLSSTEVGVLLAIAPAMAMVAPQLFGHFADRGGRPDRVLRLIAVGSALCFAPLAFVTGLVPVALTLAGYAFFSSSATNIMDALAFHRVAATGESYARLRLFGSAGFVAASIGFGLTVDAVDRRTILVPLAFMLIAAAWSTTLRARTPAAAARRLFDGLGLLARRDVVLLLAASTLHWIACAPYHGAFSLHVADLGLSPAVVGVGAGLGVAAEIGVMFLYPTFAGRLAPRHLLALAFVASAVRWGGMSLATTPAAIVALCLIHGLTFGAFYVGAVGTLAERVPAASRASGQALFVSCTFGLGGLVGYFAAGAFYDVLGGPQLFLAAAAVELVAAALVSFLAPAR